MWPLIISAGIMVAEYLIGKYANYVDPQAQLGQPNPGSSIKVPTSRAGAAIPLFYGKIRVRSPILAWWGGALVVTDPATDYPPSTAQFLYGVNMFFNIGIGFQWGVNRLHRIWSGEAGLDGGADIGIGQTGNGGLETPIIVDDSVAGDTVFIGGEIEFLNGNENQELLDPVSLVYSTYTAHAMMVAGVDGAQIPGYRGYASVFLYGPTIGTDAWIIGAQPQPDAYSFEVSTYPSEDGQFSDGGSIGDDANPVDVIGDILIGTFGKLGLSLSGRIDITNFQQVSRVLYNEGNGFSRSWEDRKTASEMLQEICQQIDGIIYDDPVDQKIRIKLIRPDYDPNTLLVISPANCSEIQNFSANGWTGIPNKVTVNWTDRANNYQPGISTAMSQANALGQDGEVREVIISVPGCMTQALGDQIAARHLASISRPLFKCTALVSRDFMRCKPGDPLRLSWPDANISNMVVRVANISAGSLDDGTIKLDLIQDYFYQWRNLPPVGSRDTGGPGALGGIGP